MKKFAVILLFIFVITSFSNLYAVIWDPYKPPYVKLVYDPWFENQHPKPVSPYGGNVKLVNGTTSYEQYFYPAEQVTRTDPEFGEVKTVVYGIYLDNESKNKKLHFAVASWGPYRTGYSRLYLLEYRTYNTLVYDSAPSGLGSWWHVLDGSQYGGTLYYVEIRYPANVDPRMECNFAVSVID